VAGRGYFTTIHPAMPKLVVRFLLRAQALHHPHHSTLDSRVSEIPHAKWRDPH
jgi:hypothetical protein